MFKFILKSIASTMNINSRVLDFGINYLSAKGTEMTLTESEVQHTKNHIYNSHAHGYDLGVAFISSLLYNLDGNERYSTHMDMWFTDATAGLVGGFDYTVEELEDKVVCHCIDTWDFNLDSGYLFVKVNKSIMNLCKQLAKTLSLPLAVEEEDGKYVVGVREEDLASLNSKCAFQTKWTVTFTKQEWKDLLSNRDQMTTD